MSILKRLFGGKAKTVNSANIMAETPLSNHEIKHDNHPPFDLFVDDKMPRNEIDTLAQSKSKISTFLDRNFHSIGIHDGYEYHSNDTLETAKKKMRAEFQLIIDQMIQEKSEKRLQLKMMVVNVEKIAEETRRNLELTIEELNASISLLQKQKELSAESEGWVMNAIHSYHQGFVQGLNDYIAGERLLNSIKYI